jgi:hypothetical protein
MNISGSEFKSFIKTYFVFVTMVLAAIAVPILFSGNVRAEQADDMESVELPGLPNNGSYSYITLADVNKDTFPDIIAGGAGYGITAGFEPDPGGIHVFLNQKGKSFVDGSNGLPKEGDDYFGSTIGGISVVDIDKDSNLDIVACEYDKQTPDKYITIFLGNGGEGGSMQWTQATAPETQTSWKMTFVGDIDGDGHTDIVASSDAGLHYFRGQHSPGVLNWTDTDTGISDERDYRGGIALGDINHDGRLDIVAGSEYGEGLFVYTCTPSGEISWTEAYEGTSLPNKAKTWGIELVDLNNDSHLDIVAANAIYGIMVYMGNGNTGDPSKWWTDASTGLPTSGDYYQVEVVDIDSDGKLDICSSLHVWSNTGNMSDPKSYSWDKIGVGISEHESIGMTVGDMDLDGKFDIAACGWEDENLPGINAYTNLVIGSNAPTDDDIKPDDDGGKDQGVKEVIYGVVTDTKTKDPITGVEIYYVSDGDEDLYLTSTNEIGEYQVNIPTGDHTLLFIKDGYNKHNEKIIVDDKMELNVALEASVSDKEDDDKTGEDDSKSSISDYWWLLLIILIVVLVVGFIGGYFLGRSRNLKDDEKEEADNIKKGRRKRGKGKRD